MAISVAPPPSASEVDENIQIGCYAPPIMAKLVQVKDVPESVHRTLKSRAALAGLSLNEYLRRELTELAARPSPDELRQTLRSIRPATMDRDPVEVLRELRDEGEE